jgi:hypothetical protein
VQLVYTIPPVLKHDGKTTKYPATRKKQKPRPWIFQGRGEVFSPYEAELKASTAGLHRQKMRATIQTQ